MGGSIGGLGGVVNVVTHLAEIRVSSNHLLHHRSNGRRTSESVGRVNDTEHALGAVVGESAIEEDGVGIVDDLFKGEALLLNTGGERRIGSLVARSKLRSLGDGVVVCAPDELDGITDGSVDGERDITKDTLGRSNPNDVGLASLGGGAVGRRVLGRRHRGKLGLALLNAVFERIVSPLVASRSVGGGRLRLISGRIVGRGVLVLATISRKGSGGTPGI